MKAKFTGERMIPEINKSELIYVEHISRYFFAGQIVKGKKVLDVACGTGYGSHYLIKQGAKEVVGVDISQEAIAYAREHYRDNRLAFVESDAMNLPFEKESFDIVVSFETIEHLKKPEKFVGEIKRILNPSGIFIISTPNAYVYPKGNIFHKKELKPQELNVFIKRYFNNSKMMYQDNILSNFILDSGKIRVKKELREINVRSAKLFNIIGKEQMYIVIVSSNGILPNIIGSNLLGYPSSLDDLKNTIIKLDEQLKKRARELELIYNSRGWRVISFFHNVRKKLPLLKKI